MQYQNYLSRVFAHRSHQCAQVPVYLQVYVKTKSAQVSVWPSCDTLRFQLVRSVPRHIHAGHNPQLHIFTQ